MWVDSIVWIFQEIEVSQPKQILLLVYYSRKLRSVICHRKADFHRGSIPKWTYPKLNICQCLSCETMSTYSLVWACQLNCDFRTLPNITKHPGPQLIVHYLGGWIMGSLHQQRSSPTIIICRSHKSLLNFNDGHECYLRFTFECTFSFSIGSTRCLAWKSKVDKNLARVAAE